MSPWESRNWIVFLIKHMPDMFICNGLLWNKRNYRLQKKPQTTQNTTPQESKNNGKDEKLWINKREADWGEGTRAPAPSPAWRPTILKALLRVWRLWKQTGHMSRKGWRQDSPEMVQGLSARGLRGKPQKGSRNSQAWMKNLFTTFSPMHKTWLNEVSLSIERKAKD